MHESMAENIQNNERLLGMYVLSSLFPKQQLFA